MLILLTLMLVFLNSCGSKDNRWITTEEGIEYFLPEDKKPSLLSFGKYYWSGDSINGLAYGMGVLKYEDTWDSHDNFSIKGFARFGAIQPDNEENLYFVGPQKDYLLDGYGTRTKNDTTIIGYFKKGRAKGEGKIFTKKELIYDGELKDNLPDGYGTLYENGILKYEGKFKKGLYHGEGVLYYPDGQQLYDGDFKEGEYEGSGIIFYENGDIAYVGGFKKGLFNGSGEINIPVSMLDSIEFVPMNQLWQREAYEKGNYIIDSITNKIVFSRDSSTLINEDHVFEGGVVKPLHAKYFELLNDKVLELEPSVYDSIYGRINHWEYNAWWEYLIIFAVLGILWLVLIGANMVDDFEDYYGDLHEKASLYFRIKKWTWWKIYPVWLLFGWFGFHRAILKSKGAFIYGALFSVLVAINLRNIVLFLFWPSSWQFMSFSPLTLILVSAIGLFLVYDIVWIPWRCYWLNHIYYRHDLRETELISSTRTDVDKLIYAIKPKTKTVIHNLNNLLKQTKEVQSQNYKGTTSSLNLKRIVNVTFGNDEWAEFELNRLQSLERVLEEYTKTQDNFAELAKNLNVYLEEARNTAYRNINLTKELIGWMRKIKTQKTILEKDRDLHSDFSNFDYSTIQMPEISLGVDFDSTCNQCFKTTNLLMKTGLRLGPALAIGAAISLVNHIADALQKAQRLCEEANEKSRLAVKGIGESLDNIVKSEADILRAYEILASLNEANKAFIKVYAPLRDAYTGESPSFSYYIRGGVIIPERDYMKDLILLQQVTSEYNKINKSKL